MSIQTEISENNFDLISILTRFKQKEPISTGSIIIHQGKVKLPGKKILNLSCVWLKEKAYGNSQTKLAEVGVQAANKFYLNQIYINHRLGKAKPGDDILLVIISAPDRVNAFSATQWIVDEIKKEKIITLTEMAEE